MWILHKATNYVEITCISRSKTHSFKKECSLNFTNHWFAASDYPFGNLNLFFSGISCANCTWLPLDFRFFTWGSIEISNEILTWKLHQTSYVYSPFLQIQEGMSCTISACHHWSFEFESRLWRGVLDTTLCDKVYQ